VAVCDQVEEPAQAKGLVKREVTRVVTAGTATEDELLDARAPNFLAAVWADRSTAGLAWADLSAGTFRAADLPLDRLPDELARLAPAECLLPEATIERLQTTLYGAARSFTTRPDWTFDPTTARQALLEQFHLGTTSGLGFDDDDRGPIAAGALLL